MNSDSIVLITKDAACVKYFPCYGNKFWEGKTPNIDELAAKGTVFTRCYTTAPSTYMSHMSMSLGLFSYEIDSATYSPVSRNYNKDSMFEKANNMGFDCHIIWDDSWEEAPNFCKCFGDNTKIHCISGLRQGVGAHYIHDNELERNPQKAIETLNTVEALVQKIEDSNNKVFLWVHLPHVLNGRISYCDDIDLFDDYVGMFRKYFSDDKIYISADHGNMNGQRNVLGYGFHVYENAIRIPLITPRKENLPVCEDVVCNVDTYDLIFGEDIPRREIVFSDSTYYAQPNRKLAIIKGKYKYIYNKLNKTEELYDLAWDANESTNLINDYFEDESRKVKYPARELYFYDSWDELPAVREELRSIKNSIWRDKPWWWKVYRKIRTPLGKIRKWLRNLLK